MGLKDIRREFYLKEEEFVEDYYAFAASAASAVKNSWHPNPACNDEMRRNQKYFMESGELEQLDFNCASLIEKEGSLRIQIVLESSHRIVNVKVSKNSKIVDAEIIVDRAK